MQTLADRFRFWYEHERAANAWLLEMLDSVPAARRAAPEFRRAVDLAAHLVQARRMWLHRLGVWPEHPGGWEAPGRDASELPALFAETERAWTAYLAGLDDAALARTLDWTGTDGVRYRWPVELVLTQVSSHAFYHRGQIVQLVGGLGGTTRSTDLIFWHRPEILATA